MMSKAAELAAQINEGRRLYGQVPPEGIGDVFDEVQIGAVYDQEGFGQLVGFLGRIAGDEDGVSYGSMQKRCDVDTTNMASRFLMSAADGADDNNNALMMATAAEVADRRAHDLFISSAAAKAKAAEARDLAKQLKTKLDELLGVEVGVADFGNSYAESHEATMEYSEAYLNDLGFPAS